MAGSLNKVTLIGNVGSDPDIRSMQNGDEVANLSIATSESWKDKNTGEKKEKTEWHRVVVFGSLVNVIKQYVKKGSKLYIEGQLETRSWEQEGQKKYTTEVKLSGFGGKMIMLDGRNSQDQGSYQQSAHDQAKANGYQRDYQAPLSDELEDEIPFL